MNNKYLLNPLLFGIVLALASVLVVTAVSQYALASYVIKGQDGGNGGNAGLFGGNGGDGGLADIDIAEAEEAENATMMTNQTTNENTTAANSTS
jgi:hypothetical protein